MKKTRVALFLALLLCVLVPALSLALGPSDQIDGIGGTVFYNANGAAVSGPLGGSNGAVVEMHKTLSPTGTENQFRVDLQVLTNQRLEELSSGTPDAALTLVFDLSNSMDDCALCGEELSHSDHHAETQTHYYCSGNSGDEYDPPRNGNRCENCNQRRGAHNEVKVTTPASCPYDSRLDMAKAAAVQFLTDFSNLGADEDGKVDAKRMVAIVTFASTAVTRLNYVDVATVSGLSDAVAIINGLTPTNNGFQYTSNGNTYTVSDDGGTNIEGALMLADNVITAGLNTTTPGALTYLDDNNARKPFSYLYTILLTDGNPTYYVSTASGHTTYIGGTRGGGSSTTDDDVDHVGDEAEDILAHSAQSKLYSICFGKNNEDVDIFNTRPFQNWSYVNPQTRSTDTVGDWLEKFSSAAFNGGASADELFDQFDSIMTQMQIAAQAWKVTDTMGPHMDNVQLDTTTGHKNTATVASDGTISWDILTSDYDPAITNVTQLSNGSYTGTLGYSLGYTVELDNLDATYTNKTAATAANTQALLDYAVYNTTTGMWEAVNDKPFPVPQVNGLVGSFSFTKKDDYNDYLSGVNFYLTCEDDPSWRYPAASGEYVASAEGTGLVSFSNLPSGHIYQLHEVTPSTHVQMGIIPVAVSWGVASPAEENSPLQSDENGNLFLENERLGDLHANITIKKTLLGDALPNDAELSFRITDGVHGYDTFTLSAQNNWTYTFPGVSEGTYTVTETDAAVDGYSHTGVSGSVTVKAQGSTGEGTNVPLKTSPSLENPALSFEIDLSDTSLDYTVTFENTYRREEGTLALTKRFMEHSEGTILGQEHVFNPMDASLYANKTVTVAVYPEGSTTSVGTLELKYDSDVTKSFTASLEGLAPGRYTLHEIAMTDPTETDDPTKIEDYVFDHSVFTSVTVGQNSSPEYPDAENAVTVDVKDGETTSVELQNHYEKIHGFIYAYKTFDGSMTEEQFVQAYKAAHNGQAPFINVHIYAGKITLDDLNVPNPPAPEATLTLSPSAIEGEDGWRAASSLLPIGDYTIVEDDTNVQLTGYELTINHPIYVTAEQFKHGQAHSVNLRNTYEQLPTSLTIIKQFAAEAPEGAENADQIKADILAAVNQHFATRSINVDIRQGDTVVETVELKADAQNADNNWKIVIEDLPYGDYTVFEELRKGAENTAFMDEYALRAMWTANDDFSITPANPDVELTVTNTYEQEFVDLVINKTVAGLPEDVLAGASFSVSIVPISDQADYRTVVLNQGNKFSAKLYHFPAGKYYVVENYDGVEVENYTFESAALTFNGATLALAEESDKTGVFALFEITEAMTHAQTVNGATPELSVSVANTYEPVPAKLIVHKQFPAVSDLQRAYFEGRNDFPGFTVNISPAVENQPSTLVLSPNAEDIAWRSEIELEPGVTYTLTEELYPVDGYQQSVYWVAVDRVNGNSNTQNTANPNTISFTAQPGQTIELVAVNTYERGSTDGFTIVKHFNVPAGNVPDDMQERINELSVTVKLTPVAGENGQAPSGMEEKTFILNAANNFTVSPADLPVGRYEVTEVGFPALRGYEQATSSTNPDELEPPYFVVVKDSAQSTPTTDSAVVDVVDGSVIAVNILNYYQQADAKLTLSKVFQSSSDLTADHFTEVKVDVLNANMEPLSPPITFVLNAGNSWKQTLDVPAGTYYLREQKPFTTSSEDTDLNDYSHTHFFTKVSVTSNGNTTYPNTTFDDNTAITLYGHDEMSVSLTNSYTQSPGSLILSKTFAGPQERWPQSVTFTVTGPSFSQTVTLPQNNQWNTTLTDLTAGTYTITENVTAGTGYRVDTTWQVHGTDGVTEGNAVNVEITPTDATAVVCTNTYEDQMTVTIPFTKTVALGGALPPSAPSPFSFQLNVTKPDAVDLTISEKAGAVGTLVTATNKQIDISMTGAGTWEGYLTFTGYAEELDAVEFTLCETLKPYATAEEAALAGWAYDASALDANKAYVAKLLNPSQNHGLMTLTRKDGTAAGGLDFVNTYTLNMPSGGIPETGDSSKLPLWTLLLAVCGAALLVMRKRRAE